MNWGRLFGYIVLLVGVSLLVFTFFTAFGFFGRELGLFGSSSLAATAIKAIYLSFMGWVGFLVTRRAVQTINGLKRKKKAEAKPRWRMSEKVETIILLLVLGLLLFITYLGGRLIGAFA